jgi:hypothetical protein
MRSKFKTIHSHTDVFFRGDITFNCDVYASLAKNCRNIKKESTFITTKSYPM